MRIRPAIAVASLTTALSMSVIPATAHAVAPAAASDTTFSDVVVNGGKDIVLGLTTKKTVTITWTATDPDGIAASWAYLWHGPNTDDEDGTLGAYPAGTCTQSSTDPTTASCTVSIAVDAARDLDHNGLAGTWNVLAGAQDRTDDWTEIDAAGHASVKRLAKATVNAAPEPVKKGRTITVTGKLTRANWTSGSYTGYQGQSVKLQFRKKGSSVYTTLKTVTTGTGGALRTTTKAKADGYFRYVFAGTATTGPATATGDFVDVR
ncbi:hypothetical protein [Streptomyces fuscichromogenes]|uniref:Calcium-binding protein n=1 Tax=Streptomyces fuscichromogenes TaxID=1324013 RepID=A0A917X9G9_9ACTN|nr:hypothetical protein [Streptomyces fuscichromogenes]GGM94624.1 hypothetical protein GCM10011578_013690 [Streptomyces fuscichromogenes]